MDTLPTTQAYECSKTNAKVNISNSEWINEFKDGIKLEKGDSVRLLGSFVNEASSGSDIEITDDMNINLQFSPYIKGQTFFTADKGTDLLDLSQIGDIPYSTDSFGIEPPGWWLSDGQKTATNAERTAAQWFWPITANTSQPQNLPDLMLGNVYATGTSRIHWGTGGSQWISQNNRACTWGTSIKTYDDSQSQTSTNFSEKHIYDDWKNFSCNNELYVAGLVKKLILPVLTGVQTNIINSANGTFEDLTADPPVAGEGMLSGVPRPGMLIATANISGASGLYDEDGNDYFETDAPTGKINLLGGVQSVIGEILAVRPMYHLIRGRERPCYEVYVHNWISPAQINPKSVLKQNIDGTTLMSNSRYISNKLTATEITGNANVNCIIQKHGAGETINGYNTNSTYNNINGAYNSLKAELGGNETNFNDVNCSVPSVYTYGEAAGSQPLGSGDGAKIFDVSCLDNNINNFKIGYSKPQGLSFLWSGSYNNQHRYPHGTIPNPNPAPASIVRQRCASNTCITTSGGGAINLDISLEMMNAEIDSQGNPTQVPGHNVPPCFGALICCKPETMKAILNGDYGRIDEGRADGRQARFWMPYTYQYKSSDYNERHYVNNSHTQTRLAVGDEPGTNGYDSTYSNPNFPAVPAGDEFRYDLEMMGRPQNQNWRERGYGGNTPYDTLIFNQGTFAFATGVGPCDTTDPNYSGDRGCNIMSTQSGINDNQWVQTGVPGGPTHAHFGCPFQNACYETSVNSIHFQDSLTGDCQLGLNYDTGVANGDYFKYTNDAFTPLGANILNITSVDINNPKIPIQDTLVYIHAYDAQGVKSMSVAAVAINSAFNFTITLSDNLVGDLEAGAFIYLSPTTTGSITSAGTEAIVWAGDFLIMREKVAKVKVKNGFYTQEQLANVINDQLHFKQDKYKKELGDSNGAVPTNIGLSEKALSSQNTAIHGNFCHTYIPDLNYGFSPITTTNATALSMTASTKELTDLLYTYEPQQDGGGNWIYYYESNLPAYDGVNVRKITDNPTQYPTLVGKHVKCYSVPYLKYDTLNKQVHLFRLRGGALNRGDAETNPAVPAPTPPATTPPEAPESFKKWELKETRFAGYYEGLRDLRTQFNGENVGDQQGSAYSYCWRTRLNRNLLNYGGSAKIFVGANNFTISFVDEVNKFSLNNLYTPIRPHISENPSNTSFGVDDAVPSAIIGAELTGNTEDMLSGIYINRLNGNRITIENFGQSWYDNILYDSNTDAEQVLAGTNFLEALGYSQAQQDNFNNSFTNADLFIYNGETLQSGTAIRVGAKVTPSINGSNPFANSCTTINPVQQYFVEVDTDDFFADNPPTLGRSPYYYIGSDFPAKEFFGNITGSKLPVIGICARNFHSFNFAFDLGASSISYTIDEDRTITSIHTAIYNNDLKSPANLSRFSSIIYLITKNKFFANLPQAQQITKSQMIEANYSAPYNPYFYNQAPVNYRSAPPPIIPSNYTQDIGQPPQLMEDYDSDLE